MSFLIKYSLLILFSSFLAVGIVNAESNPVQVTKILATDKAWDGGTLPGFSSGQTQLQVVHFRIQPGAKTVVHMHPINGAGYIISGELTMYSTKDLNGSFENSDDVDKITLTAGEAWGESVNTWHYGENNSDKDVEFIVVFAGGANTPPTLSLHDANPPKHLS